MIKLLILADDFTGALDTGVQLAACGTNTLVITDPAMPLAETDPAVEILVVDTETRHTSAQKAKAVVAGLAQQAAALRIPYIYKKTDSALRGNLGAELSGLLETIGGQLAFFLAFPQMGRRTVNGVHYIQDVPVSESVFGKDPFEPVRESSVAKLIGMQTDLSVLSLPPLKQGDTIPQENGILVFDASTDEELQAAGQRLRELAQIHLFAGCAGFAAVLPELIGLSAMERRQVPPLDQRLLVLCGSVNPITVEQLDYAQQAGFLRLRMRPEQKLHPAYWSTPEGREQLRQWSDLLAQGNHAILDTNDVDDATKRYAQAEGLSKEDIRVNISTSLGCILKALNTQKIDGTLLITGGDILFQCMNCMGIHEMQPLLELEPGVVLSSFEQDGRKRYVISKSGGFGKKTLLTDLIQFLQHQNNR